MEEEEGGGRRGRGGGPLGLGFAGKSDLVERQGGSWGSEGVGTIREAVLG